MSSGTQFYSLRVKDIRRETPECVSVSFDIPESLTALFHYQPGQYLTLRTHIDDTEVRRSYSICSAPSDGELRVAVKQMDKGKFSNFVNNELQQHALIEVMPPMGKFIPNHLNAKGRKYLAIAAGSGITPVMSIMKTILEQDDTAHFTLIFGNRNRSSIIFKENIEALKNKYLERLSVYHVFTRETLDAPLFNGRLNADKIAGFCDKLIDPDQIDEVFICGPEEMILNLREYFLNTREMDQHKVHIELFSSPDQPRHINEAWKEKQQTIDPSKTSRVTVKLDGRAFDMNLAYVGESILDAALQQGADLPYACKGGVCCTCRAKLVEGEVDMEVNYALEPDEIANKFILTCQSHPRTERVVVDFDIK